MADMTGRTIDQLAATVRQSLDDHVPDGYDQVDVGWDGPLRREAKDALAELAARATQAEDYPPGTTRLEVALTENLQAAEAEAARLREQLDEETAELETLRIENLNRAVAAEARCAQLEQALDGETLARKFHETYERLAPEYGYETRRESAVPWERVPAANRALMIAVATEIAREALAGPDTPACVVCGLPIDPEPRYFNSDGKPRHMLCDEDALDRPADSQPKDTA